MRVNTALPNNIKGDAHFWYDPTITYFMFVDSSQLNYSSGKVAGTAGIYVQNQVTLKYDTIFVYDDSYIDKLYIVYFDPYLYYKYFKLACVNSKIKK